MRKPKDFGYPAGFGENYIDAEDFNLTQARKLLAFAERLVAWLEWKKANKPTAAKISRSLFRNGC